MRENKIKLLQYEARTGKKLFGGDVEREGIKKDSVVVQEYSKRRREKGRERERESVCGGKFGE